MPPSLDQVVAAIIARRKRMSVVFGGPDCCIGAAAVAVEVLKHFGFEARALAVSASVEKSGLPVFIGFTGRYHGSEMADIHVVVMVEGNLLDLSIDSAGLINPSLDIPPVFLTADAIRPTFAETQTVVEASIAGNRLRYTSYPEIRSYLSSEHWADRDLRKRIVATIVKDVEE